MNTFSNNDDKFLLYFVGSGNNSKSMPVLMGIYDSSTNQYKTNTCKSVNDKVTSTDEKKGR